MGTKKSEIYTPILNSAFEEFGVTTAPRICAFIAQVAHESGSFVYLKEIASGAAYEGRKDLGNTQPGDGVKFKGRGLIQITGRANYTLAGKALGLDLINHPELLELPVNAVRVSCWYWATKKLNVIADNPDTWTAVYRKKTYNKFEYITLLINGGQNGLEDRKKFYNKAKLVLRCV
jgi:putative chitinase